MSSSMFYPVESPMHVSGKVLHLDFARCDHFPSVTDIRRAISEHLPGVSEDDVTVHVSGDLLVLDPPFLSRSR